MSGYGFGGSQRSFGQRPGPRAQSNPLQSSQSASSGPRFGMQNTSSAGQIYGTGSNTYKQSYGIGSTSQSYGSGSTSQSYGSGSASQYYGSGSASQSYGIGSDVQGYGSNNYQSSASTNTYSNYSAPVSSGIRTGGNYSGSGSGVSYGGSGSGGNYSGSGSGGNYSGSGSGGNYGGSGSIGNYSGSVSGGNYSGSVSGGNFGGSGSGGNYSGSGSGGTFGGSGTGGNYSASISGGNLSGSGSGGGYGVSGGGYNYNEKGSGYYSGSGSGANLSGYGRSGDYSSGQSNVSGSNYPASGGIRKSTADALTLSDFIGKPKRDTSLDTMKRKYGTAGRGAEEYDSRKKQRLSDGSSSQAAGSGRTHEKKLMYLGNLPTSITKEKIDSMFEYIPGIMSYSLRRHKFNNANIILVVKLVSSMMATNLQKTFNGMEVNGRSLVCRDLKNGEEENFIPDLSVTSDNFSYESKSNSGKKPPGKKPPGSKKQVCIWNLPSTSTRADLENFISDLNYRSMNFIEGDMASNQTGSAYFDFDDDRDAQRMVDEIQGSLYFGTFINARFEYQQGGETRKSGDDYVSMGVDDAENFVTKETLPPPRSRPAAPLMPKKQPSEYFEEFIKGQENIPLIGLEYVTEYSSPFKAAPRYACDLCSVTPHGGSIVGHVSGFKHRMKHMEKEDPELHSRITSMSQQKQFLTSEALKYALDVERQEGRQLIKVVRDPEKPKLIVEEDQKKEERSDLFSRITAYKQKVKDIEEVKQQETVPPIGQTQQPGQVRGDTPRAIAATSKAAEIVKQKLKSTKEPVLGLDFIKEKPDSAKTGLIHFTCSLCDSQLSANNIIQHIIGLAHRLEYLRRRHYDLFLACNKISNRSTQRNLVQGHVKDLLMKDGTGTLRIGEETISGEQGTGQSRDIAAPPISRPTSAGQGKASVQAVNMGNTASGKKESAADGLIEEDSSKAQLFEMTKNMDDEPLVGLRYVTETQSYNSYDPPKFKCGLCVVEVSKPFIITHLTGHQHRIAYIKENYPELLKDAENDKEMANKYCRDIENEKGREPLTVVKMIPPKDLNSPVTFSTIKVNAPSKATKAPIPEVAEEDSANTTKAAKDSSASKFEIQNKSRVERRAEDLQKRLANFDKLTPHQQDMLEKQLKRDGKKADGTVVHFSDLIAGRDEPIIGLGECVEIRHPKDTEPPLYCCELCNFSTDHKGIIQHVTGKSHGFAFFKKKKWQTYSWIKSADDESKRSGRLRIEIRNYMNEYPQDMIRCTVAADDVPWKMKGMNLNLTRFMKTPSKQADARSDLPARNSEDTKDYGDKMAKTSFSSNKGTAKEGGFVADLIHDTALLDDEKWEEINGEIKKRIGDGRITILKEPAKFLKTYKPFLGKFPVIGLEWMTEFQQTGENSQPWYLCRLCRSKVSWDDIVDHVISVYHRMSYIQKEHPTLHELLKVSTFESGELNEKIEEFAKGIAKTPGDEVIEVLMEKGPKKPKPLLSELSEKAQQPAAKQAPTIPDIRAIEIPFRSRSQETRQGSRQTTDTGSGPQRSEVRPGLSQGNMSDRPMTFDYKHGLTTGDRYQEMGEREEPVKSAAHEPALNIRNPPGARPKFHALHGFKAKGPLIGLEYMVEVQVVDSKKPPHYTCDICDCKLIPGSVLPHLLGLKHKLNFFEIKDPDIYHELTEKTDKRNMNKMAEKYATDYIRINGKGSMNVMLETEEEQLQQRQAAKATRMEAREARMARKAAKRRDKEVLESLEKGKAMRLETDEAQITPSQSFPERSGQMQSRLSNQLARFGQEQSLASTTTAIGGQMKSVQTSQGMSQVQFGQNQTMLPLNQSLMNQKPGIIQQNPTFSQFPQQNVLGQQQLQQQPQRTVLGQQQPQLQQFQMPLQQSQMVTQMGPNAIQVPQQTIQMGIPNPNIGQRSQQVMMQQPQQIFHGIQNPVQLRSSAGLNQTVMSIGNQGINQLSMVQQHTSQPRGPSGFNSQKQMTSAGLSNVQRPSQPINQKQFGHQQQISPHLTTQKSHQNQRNVSDVRGNQIQNFDVAEGNKSAISKYRIPKTDHHQRDNRQEEYNNSRQRGNKQETLNGSNASNAILIDDDNLEPSSGVRDHKNKVSSYGRPRDSQSSGSPKMDRYSRTDRFGRSFDMRSDNTRRDDSKREDSKSKSSDHKSGDVRKNRSLDRRSMDESKKPSDTKHKDERSKSKGKNKSSDSIKDEQKTKSATQEENKAYPKSSQQGTKVPDKTAGVGKSTTFPEKTKSGSYIEIGGSSDRNKNTKKDERIAGNITIELIPTDMNIRSDKEKQDIPLDNKGNEVEVQSVHSDKQVGKSETKSKVEEKTSKKRPPQKSSEMEKPSIEKNKTVKSQTEGKSEIIVDRQDTDDVSKSEIKIKKGKGTTPLSVTDKLSCTVTVDLIDIAKVSTGTLMKQNTDNKQPAIASSSTKKAVDSNNLDKTKASNVSKKEVFKLGSSVKDKRTEMSADENKTPESKETGHKEDKNKADNVEVILSSNQRRNFQQKTEEASEMSSKRDARSTVVIHKAESVEVDLPDEWAVTDEWREDEPMDISENSKGKELSNQDSKTEELVSVVSVTFEMEGESSYLKPSGEQKGKRDENIITAEVQPERSSTNKKKKESEKNNDTEESMDFKVTDEFIDAEDENNEYSEDDDEFLDLSQFVTLDEEGEVDEQTDEAKATGYLPKKYESYSETKTSSGARDGKQKDNSSSRRQRSRDRDSQQRKTRSRSKEGSRKGSTKRDGSRSRRSARSDRSKSKDKESPRRDRSRSKGSQSRKSQSTGDSKTSHEQASVQKNQSEAKTGINKSKPTMEQGNIPMVQIEINTKPEPSQVKAKTGDAEKAGLIASSKGLVKDVSSLGVPLSSKPVEKPKPAQTKIEAPKSNQCSIEIEFGGEADKKQKDKDSKKKVDEVSGSITASSQCMVEIGFGEEKQKLTKKDRTSIEVSSSKASTGKEGKDKSVKDETASSRCMVEIGFGEEEQKLTKKDRTSIEVSSSKASTGKEGKDKSVKDETVSSRCMVEIGFGEEEQKLTKKDRTSIEVSSSKASTGKEGKDKSVKDETSKCEVSISFN